MKSLIFVSSSHNPLAFQLASFPGSHREKDVIEPVAHHLDEMLAGERSSIPLY